MMLRLKYFIKILLEDAYPPIKAAKIGNKTLPLEAKRKPWAPRNIINKSNGVFK
jgi:hypothetical protein